MTLIIEKEANNLFSITYDGGEPIRTEQNRLTTIGDFSNFKTANGANLVLKQNIPVTEITVIASGTFTFSTMPQLWNKLIQIGFFDGVANSGGGSVIDRFDELADTFNYFGRDGQVVTVNESQLRLETQPISLFTPADRDKLDGIQAEAEKNVQADASVTDPSNPAYIKNFPNIPDIGADKENTTNKQNSLAVDGTGVKFPTVDAVVNSTVNFNPKTTKIAFIGDSITYGVGSTSGETSYADILNSFFGFQTYTKLGFSSMTVKPSSPRPQLSDKIALIPAGTNFITLMIGINDWAENNVIGDVNVVNAKTYASLNQNLSFAEAFRYNLETIKRNFPNAQIRVITPIKHDDTWNRDLDFKFYVEAEMQIANFLSIPIINAYDGSEIYQSSTSTYIPDGIHPNDAGYNMIAEFVKKGIVDKKTEHQSNTQYNSLVVGKQELRSNTSGETLRLTGKGFNGGDDSVGGVSLGLFFNGSGNRYSYLGGSDSQKKLIFYDNSINVYDFTNGVYSNLDLGSFGKRVNVGNSLGSGDIMNISNYTYPASNVLLGLFGGVGQFGDYIKIEDVSSNTLLRFKASGDLEISGKAIVSTAPTNANDVVRKTELDLKANLASPALTGTPTAPTPTEGTNTTQIATTAFVLANAGVTSAGTTNRIPKFTSSNSLGDSGLIQVGGNIGMGSAVVPGELFHIGDGNILLEGGGEVAQKFKRDFTTTGENLGVPTGSGISVNPIFQVGRIIQAGDGDPEIRIMYSDDNASERTVFEVDRKGIAASVKTSIGSHFEGFASLTDVNPKFRLNSYPRMRLEMGAGGNNITDVAVERGATGSLDFFTNSAYRGGFDSSGNLNLLNTPTAPTASAGTNTTQIATTAFVQAVARPYKVYTALLSQSGTNAPVATVLENTLGGTVTWSRTSAGKYLGTLTGAFTGDKTASFFQSGSSNAEYTYTYDSYKDSNNSVRLYAFSNGLHADQIIAGQIEIRVYN